MHYLLIFILTIFFSSCSSKSNNIIFEKPDNSLFVNIVNKNEINNNLLERLKTKFESNGIKINDDSESKNRLIVEYIFEDKVDKKTIKSEILSNSNINISIGQVFGNVGVSGTIGTKAGNIFNVDETYKIYKIIVDINYTNEKSENNSTTLIEYESLEDKSKNEAKKIVEDRLSTKIFELFK